MLYTSGTTAKPKGVPRRQRAERAAALAQVAQNLYRSGERTLGVMPLYHTMGVRSLLAMSLIGGAFVCLPRFDVVAGAGADRGRKGHQSLSGADALPRPGASRALQADRCVLGAQARLRRRLDDRRTVEGVTAAFKPELFVNHYGSSEIYTFTIDQNAPNKPGSAGRAGINQMVRVVRLGAASPDEIARPARKARSSRSGWRRILRGLLAAARSRRQGAAAGLVLHRRHRLFRRRRRSVRHRPGRRHDHHRRRERLAGRDRKLPVAAPGGDRGRGGRPARRALGQDRYGLHQAQRAGRRRRSRRVLPRLGPRQLQAAAPLCVRRDHPEIAGRQALAPPAGRGRIPNGTNAPRSQGTAA